MSQSSAEAASLSFTLAQHAIILEWAAPRPWGLRAEISLEMESADEVLCITHRHVIRALYLLTPLEAGRVEVLAVSSWFNWPEYEAWEEPGIADALAAVIEWERDLDEAG